MESEPLLLFQQTTHIFHHAARYFVDSSSKAAVKARELVNRSAAFDEPFHAVVLDRLSALKASIEASRQTSDLAHAQNSIRQTLDTFEALISAKDNTGEPQPLATGSYAGLQGLRTMYRAYANSKNRSRSLGFRKYLYCPPADLRSRLKQDIATCRNVLSDGLDGGGNADILSELESLREWPVPPSMLDHATRVRDVLFRHWDCDCGEEHREVKLAFTASPRSTADQSDVDLVGCYRLYWPREDVTRQTSSAPLLHLIKAQREYASYGLTRRSKSKSRSVRFLDDATEGSSSRERQNAASETFSTICEAIAANSGRCVVRANEETVGSFALTSDASTTSGVPIQSLRSLLVPGKIWSLTDMTSKQRIVMAVALAYAYLHLCDTDWWPRREVRPDFWFMNSDAENGLKTGLPFLAFTASPSASHKTKTTESFINAARPSLPAFGKLLLEIWKGAPLAWGDELDAALEECERDWVGQYWLCAVNACLGSESVLREDGPLHSSARMRSIFVLKVIKSLQWLFEKCVRSSFDAVFPAPEPLPHRFAPVRSKASTRAFAVPIRASLNTSEASNSLCLHDGAGGWEPCGEMNKEAANVWLRQLQNDVHHVFEPRVDPIKIAVIDTGVLFSKRTRKLYQGRVREVRSFVRERDGECGILCSEGEDTDGHGTHATSVLLEVDPYSEVFVAKVFEKRDQKQGESLQEALQLGVARAITHAIQVWKVQVISLSFGFEYQVGIIQKALLAAEHANVIVLAAASNNGGNNTLSWPSREPKVFDIYATNGYGNSYERNPTPRRRDDNFAVLGACVNGWWHSGERVIRSGTSTATPVAAGLASLCIHFVRQHASSYGQKQNCSNEDLRELCQRISTYSGMRRIFRRMVDPDTGDRDGYCYITPWLLFNKNISKETIIENIMSELRQA